MARSSTAVIRRPRGQEAAPERPSAFRLWLRRRRGLVKPGLYTLALAGVVGAAAMGVMTLNPGAQVASLGGVFAGLGTGMRVQQVMLEGRRNAPLVELRRALGVERGDPILAFSPQAARERLEANAWVKTAEVERRLPDTIMVRITERSPYAIWQNGGVVRVIDERGHVISDRIDDFGLLPWVVGQGANEHAARMVELLRAVPELRDRAEVLVRVGNRRWNLRLRNGTEIRLPEGQEEAALRRLQEQHRSIALLDRPVAVIDLRLPDKMTVQVAPPGAAPATPAPQPANARSGRG